MVSMKLKRWRTAGAAVALLSLGGCYAHTHGGHGDYYGERGRHGEWGERGERGERGH